MDRLIGIAALLSFGLAVGTAHAAQNNSGTTGTWSGIIVNSACTADEAFAESARCTQTTPDGKVALYDDTTKEIFSLEPQTQAVGHLGAIVTVSGTLDAKSIQVASIEVFKPVGLAVGQKAPAFSARDQFGQQQTLDTLKGANGTVILFFRSADW